MIFDFEPGDKVFNPSKKEWGIGQVQSIIKEKITINFDHLFFLILYFLRKLLFYRHFGSLL